MSKSKFTKILVAVLSFCLILGTIFGVSAFAAETENSEAAAPKIISKNVEYGSKVYLYYAVPVASIPEADRVEGGVWLNVYDADGTLAFKQFAEEATVDIYGDGTVCYIFKTRGVPAKELNTVEKVQVETKSGAKGELESYSVEEYLYDRLYNEGFAAKTEADTGTDGKDYIRRGLYYNLLKYGAIAQELLAPGAEDKIGDAAYLDVEEATAKGGFVSSDKIYLVYDGESANSFDAWEYVRYDEWGKLVDSGYALNRSVFINAPGYIKATPVFHNLADNIYDFEDGTLPTKYTWGSGVDVAEDPVDSNNKVAKIEAASDGHSQILYADKVEDASVTVIEFSAYWENISSKKVELWVYPNYGSGRDTNCMQMFYISTTEVTAYKNKGGSDFKATGISNNAWVDIRIEYRVIDVNGQRVPEWKFFVNGALKDVFNDLRGGDYYTNGELNSAKVPSPTDLDKFQFYFSTSVTSGNVYLDNVNFVQGSSVTTTYESPAAELYDFNSANDYEGVLNVNKYDNVVELSRNTGFDGTVYGEDGKNTWKLITDEASGDGYLEIHKHAVDSPNYNGGVSLIPKVTYSEDGYNTMVMEIDLYMENVKSTASEILICPGGKTGTSNAPFLFQLPRIYNKWLHVVVTYRPTKVDASGKVLEFESSISCNGEVYDQRSGAIADAYGANIKSGATPLPVLDSSIYFKFGFNNGFNGDIKVDNIGVKLLNVASNDPVVAS